MLIGHRYDKRKAAGVNVQRIFGWSYFFLVLVLVLLVVLWIAAVVTFVATEGGATDVERALEVGRPTRTIVEYADEHDIDQIVMGSHGRSGMSRILLGSVAEIVVRRATVPVTVVR